MLKKYAPAPINVEDVVLPENLSLLIEKLAENTHEIWATERMKAGWSYGTLRDDSKKETPCMVEFAALSEEEKNYDREIVVGTLKTIFKLGYTILAKNP